MDQSAIGLAQGFSLCAGRCGNFGRIRGFDGPPHRREGPSMRVKLPVREAILNRHTYEAPAEGRSDKLRLDFNENTTGCSPALRRALAKLTTKQLAMYPEDQA